MVCGTSCGGKKKNGNNEAPNEDTTPACCRGTKASDATFAQPNATTTVNRTFSPQNAAPPQATFTAAETSYEPTEPEASFSWGTPSGAYAGQPTPRRLFPRHLRKPVGRLPPARGGIPPGMSDTFPRQNVRKRNFPGYNASTDQGRILPMLRELEEYQMAAPRYYSTPTKADFVPMPGPTMTPPYEYSVGWSTLEDGSLDVEYTDRIFTESELAKNPYNLYVPLPQQTPSPRAARGSYPTYRSLAARPTPYHQEESLAPPPTPCPRRADRTYTIRAPAAEPMTWGSIEPASTMSYPQGRPAAESTPHDGSPQLLVATPPAPKREETMPTSESSADTTVAQRRKKTRSKRLPRTPIQIYVNVSCSCENIARRKPEQMDHIPDDLMEGLNNGTYSIVKNLPTTQSVSSPSDMEESCAPSRPTSSPAHGRSDRAHRKLKMGVGPSGVEQF